MKKHFIEPKILLRQFLTSNVVLASDNFGHTPDDWLSEQFFEENNL